MLYGEEFELTDDPIVFELTLRRRRLALNLAADSTQHLEDSNAGGNLKSQVSEATLGRGSSQGVDTNRCC